MENLTYNELIPAPVKPRRRKTATPVYNWIWYVSTYRR